MSVRAQIFAVLLSLGSIVFILRLVRKRQLRAKYSLLWLSVGLAGLLLAISPKTLDRVSKFIGVAYPPAVFFLLAIILLLLVVIHTSWELSRLEERTRVLAEHLALLGDEERFGRAAASTAQPGHGGVDAEVEAEVDAGAGSARAT